MFTTVREIRVSTGIWILACAIQADNEADACSTLKRTPSCPAC